MTRHTISLILQLFSDAYLWGGVFRWLVPVVSVGAFANVIAPDNLTSLEGNGINSWEPKVFSGETTYSLLEYQNRIALKAASDHSASGLVLKKQIDLVKTPYLNWSWLAENKLPLP